MRRKWDTDNEALQRKCIEEIITRIEELDGDAPGVVAAQDIIDIVTENLAPGIYNMAIADAKKMVSEKLSDLDIDLISLEQTVH